MIKLNTALTRDATPRIFIKGPWPVVVVRRGTWRFSRESRLTQSCSRGWKLRLTFRLGNYIRSFPYTFGPQMKDIGTLRPGFYSEFRYKSYEHSGLAYGAIFKKVLVLTLIPRLPCSFFQEHVPKIIQGSTTQPLEPHARPHPPARRPYFQDPGNNGDFNFQYFHDRRN